MNALPAERRAQVISALVEGNSVRSVARMSGVSRNTIASLLAYLQAVDEAFGAEIDYAMLVKLYGADVQGDTRYSPAACLGAKAETITGRPERKHVSTSYVERQNLTMRLCMRRFTRLTNGFSKKLENHIAAVSLHCMFYNFVRIHQTLRVTPAMAAGVTDHVWNIADIVALLDQKPKKPNYQDEAHYGPALGYDPTGHGGRRA
jgi:hypothetical protein